MDLRQIRCFIVVAEELHFRRAAERVGLAQTALSAQVRNLEEELGFPLLFRTTRHVSLTQAGAVFLEECRGVLERLDIAVDLASAAAHSGLDRLRIGGIDAALVWFLPPVFSAFRRQHPGIRLQLTEVSSSLTQVDELARHRVDLCFFRPPVDREGLNWDLLFEERVFVALPESDPLASASSVAAKEVQDRTLISYPRHARPYLADVVDACFRRLDKAPTSDFQILDKSTLLRLISEGAGIGLVPQWVTETPAAGVRFIPLQNAPILQFGVAWRDRDQDNRTLIDFLALARAQAEQVKARFAKPL